jgi:hypothetical protein
MNWNLAARPRLTVALRVLAAAVGGYALTSAITILIALTLSVPPPKMAAQLLSYPIYVGIILWVFHAKMPGRVWLLFWTLVVSVI